MHCSRWMPLFMVLVMASSTGFSVAQGAASAARQSGPPYVGFDRNDYPGDAALLELRKHFAFTGYWLTNPPGETANTWRGKRATVRGAGFGFLVLADGRLDKEIVTARRSGQTPAKLGEQDARAAVAAAKREGFPPGTIVFVDQEEGGRLLEEQAGYLLGWTEAIASSDYRPGVYASGQPVTDGPGATITTVQDIRQRVAAGHLHSVALWIAQDACPPAPGCVLQAPPLSASGIAALGPDHASPLVAWQYAQSPRRPDITRACGRTYNPDGKCYSPAPAGIFVDLSSADAPDPSHGR